MRNEVVTVFGGSGFLGRYVVRRLAAEGAQVRVVCRYPQQALHLRTMGEIGQVVVMRGNVAAETDLASYVDGATAVINLVGILFQWGRQRFDAVQATAPGRMAAAAREAGATRFVHLSAIGADTSSDAAYARTKAAGETAVLEEFAGATILRPSVVFGAEDDFFNRFAQMAGISPFLPLIGGGQTRFQPVYVDDVAQAVMKALTDPDTRGQTYELGGPDVYTFKELLEYLVEVLGRKRLLLDVPTGLANVKARFFEYLPKPPLTRDQIALLATDNVVSAGAKTFADLGIQPTPMQVVVPTYVQRYARHQTQRA
ncbi:MAG: complex I NDUFA9 subunit family protein [Pseudomonadota bacterium]